MAMGGIASGLVSAFHNGTSMPMIAIMVLCIIGGLTILVVGDSASKMNERRSVIEEDNPGVL